jgi:uncharacterized protein YPO0396
VTYGLELDLFDSRRVGFRLQRLEVYNWGTFDGRVWAVGLDGDSGLLTGDIGSGKSTLVDAVTTLLVAPQRISYNKAAGAELRERTLASYVLGHYKSERSQEGSSAKPVALRSANSYSVLLAVFRNEALGQSVTLAQVFWFRDNGGQPSRMYVVADREASIAADFAGFGADIAALRRRLRESEASLHDSYSKYAADFRRRFGIEHAQALELFHQTVSMKSVGNLTEFVRQHMLEPPQVKDRIDGLINHFEDLTKAHDAVLTAKEQVAALEPLVAGLDQHAAAAQRAEHGRALRDCLHGHIVARRLALLQRRGQRLAAELDGLRSRRDALAHRHAAAQNDEVDLQTALRSQGGDRLAALEADINAAAVDRDKKRRAAEDYQRLCRQVGLDPARDEASFAEQHRRIAALAGQTQARQDELLNQRSELAVTDRELRTRLDEVIAELKGLAERDSNIDQRMVALRAALCTALGLGAEQLPFAGELLRVDDADWEPAAERLLHGFALSLLVPERHYPAVARWVDDTDLRGRLVYYRVRGGSRGRRVTDPRSLVHKLAVKPGSPHTEWLRAEVARRFDLVCARTPAAEHAITRKGQIKSGGQRHEKDDRRRLGDRRDYVLGWDNAAKRRALEEERDGLTRSADASTARLRTLTQESGSLITRTQQLAVLADRRDFADIDWGSQVARIESLTAELESLRAASDTLRELDRRLGEVRAAKAELAQKLTSAEQAIGGVQQRIATDTALAEQLRAEDVPAVPDDLRGELEELEQQHSGAHGLSIEGCEATERRIRDAVQAGIDAQARQMERASERILRDMNSFRTRWPLASQEMDAAVEAGGEYRDALQRLRTDDLPRFEANFKRQLNVNAIREVVGFRTALEAAREDIARRVDTINTSLRDIDYQPHTYIRLESTPTADADVREFRTQLRACTEDTVTGSDDDRYSEAKFLQVKQIVSRFQGRDGRSEQDRRWTAKVTDVRNWFTFAASERLRADDSEHEHYSDSGGKSGGQKEKLAYTILAASLANQFGLVSGETHSRTFRFVVIDEAFGRGSDESARFGLELFKRLQLQLLVVTPLQKIHIIEPYVSHVGYVHNQGGTTSMVRNLTIEAYRDEKAARKHRDQPPTRGPREQGAAQPQHHDPPSARPQR